MISVLKNLSCQVVAVSITKIDTMLPAHKNKEENEIPCRGEFKREICLLVVLCKQPESSLVNKGNVQNKRFF